MLNILNGVLIPKIIQSSLHIAMNHTGGRRKILKKDIESAIFSMFTLDLYIGANGNQSHTTILSSSRLKKHILEILENNRQYQKLPTVSMEYLKRVLEFIIKLIFNETFTRVKVLNDNNSDVKSKGKVQEKMFKGKIFKENIQETIAKNANLSHIFPQEAINYWKS
jgi:AMMECR1 domain-containing protein